MFTGQRSIGDIEAATGRVLRNNDLKKFAKLTAKKPVLQSLFLKKLQVGGFLLLCCYCFLKKIFMFSFSIFDLIISMYLSIFSELLLQFKSAIHLYWPPHYSGHLFILQILICIVLIEISIFSWILQMFHKFVQFLCLRSWKDLEHNLYILNENNMHYIENTSFLSRFIELFIT